jgi:hypothetical protein
MIWDFLIKLIAITTLPVIALLTLLVVLYHRRKMEVIRQRGATNANESIIADLQAVRAEIQQLRDTAMQYDLSFDASLQRLEQRMHRLEQEQLQQQHVRV